MTEREEFALLERVRLMEELLNDVSGLLRKYVAKAAQGELLPPTALKDGGISLIALRAELVARFLVVTGKVYIFDGAKDASAVKRLHLLKPELRTELLARWEECLRMKAFPGCQSLALFASRVNSFGQTAKPVVAAVVGDPYAA